MTVGSDGKPVLKLVEILTFRCPMYMTDKNPDHEVPESSPSVPKDVKEGKK